MSDYENRILPPGPVWDGQGDPPSWVLGPGRPPRTTYNGCGCASCQANGLGARDSLRSGIEPEPVDDDPESVGSNPYEALRRLNLTRGTDPLTVCRSKIGSVL